MSRLIKVFVNPVLFRVAGDPGPNTIPLYQDRDVRSGFTEEVPEGGVYCQFITAYQHLRDYQDDKSSVVGWIPGNGLKECYEIFGMDRRSNRPWIKVLYQETIGWISLSHVSEIYEIDFDENGDGKETLVYPYPS